MKKTFSLAILLLGLAMILAACGGPSGPSNSINVTISDFAFAPKEFTVRAGTSIDFLAKNSGAVQHDFIIMQLGKDVQHEFTDADKPNVFWEKLNIPAGGSVSDTFVAPSEPGVYQIVCGVSGHFQAGMVAKLTVVK